MSAYFKCLLSEIMDIVRMSGKRLFHLLYIMEIYLVLNLFDTRPSFWNKLMKSIMVPPH